MRTAWLKGLGKALLYGLTSALVLFALAVALSGPSQRERRQTARNVATLVEESRKNRELLCLGIVRGAEDLGTLDPDVLRICSDVGVEPGVGEPMLVPFLPFIPLPGFDPQPAPTPSPQPPGAPSPSEAPEPSPSEPPTPSVVPSVSLPPLPTPSCLPLVCEEEG